EAEQTPLIEPIDGDSENMLVTVVWKDTGDIDRVSVIGEFFGFDTDENILNKIQDTDVWHRSYVCPNDVRSLYCFTINDEGINDWEEIDKRIDSYNPNQYICPKDEEHPENCALISEIESVLEMPKAKEKIYIKERDSIEKGNLELYRFESKILNNSRRVWVYTPANYDETEVYGMAIFFDGWEYINIIKAPTIIDNLIADNLIQPICSVFIESSDDRDNELTCHKPFIEFLTTEILPWIYKGYSITKDAQNIILAGCSYGALAASYGALIHSEKFGKVLGQSGGFSWKPEGEEDGWIIREYEKSAKLPIDFYLDIGSFELRWPFVSKAIQEMTDVLCSKGYNLKYSIFTGGHVYLDWQDTLADGLVYLINKN
ncbi:MAG: alpha/beta hydrolase-fold protein, partial [Clostridiaceae bacterium]